MVQKNGQPIFLPHGQPKKAQPLTPRTITMRHGLHGVENRCPKVSVNQGKLVTSDNRFETDMSNICKKHTVDVVMPDACGVAVRCAGGELSYADCREMRACFDVTPQIVEDGGGALVFQLDIPLVTAFPIPSSNPNWTCARPESLAALTDCKEFQDALKSAACRWQFAGAALQKACLTP